MPAFIRNSPPQSDEEIPGLDERLDQFEEDLGNVAAASILTLPVSRVVNNTDAITLTAADAAKVLVISRSTNNTLSFPRGDSIPDTAAGVIEIEGTGQTTLQASGGQVFFKVQGGNYLLTSNGQHSKIWWWKKNFENYHFVGGLTPSTDAGGNLVRQQLDGTIGATPVLIDLVAQGFGKFCWINVEPKDGCVITIDESFDGGANYINAIDVSSTTLGLFKRAVAGVSPIVRLTRKSGATATSEYLAV